MASQESQLLAGSADGDGQTPLKHRDFFGGDEDDVGDGIEMADLHQSESKLLSESDFGGVSE